LGENCEVSNDAGPQFASGSGQDFGKDGVVDIDIESGLTLHGDCPITLKASRNDTHFDGWMAN